MDGDLKKWRQQRLSALADKLGSKAELGRQLGYRDGAFVGQMISGLRPITEKTIEAAEKVRGPSGETFRGWFAREAPRQDPATIFDAPTREELELLDNFRHMLDDDREELAAEIARRAAKAKENVDKYIQRLGLTPRPQTASAKAAGSTSRATVPPAQGSLDLEPKQRRVGAK